MKQSKFLVYGSLVAVAVAVGLFVYLVNISRAFSYLSDDSKACVNCHIMNTYYATWERSSHANSTSCVSCHLPTNSFVDKYKAKAKDGWNHSVAFTLDTYGHTLNITEDGAQRVQANCVSCHASLTSTLAKNYDLNHDFANPKADTGRKCWDCHKSVPHGEVRGLTATPDTLGVRSLKLD